MVTPLFDTGMFMNEWEKQSHILIWMKNKHNIALNTALHELFRAYEQVLKEISLKLKVPRYYLSPHRI
jgi:hypothetical protein